MTVQLISRWFGFFCTDISQHAFYLCVGHTVALLEITGRCAHFAIWTTKQQIDITKAIALYRPKKILMGAYPK